MNYEDLRDWCADARRSVEREKDRLQEQQLAMGNHLRVLEAAGELLAEIDRQKHELEQKQSEIDELRRGNSVKWEGLGIFSPTFREGRLNINFRPSREAQRELRKTSVRVVNKCDPP